MDDITIGLPEHGYDGNINITVRNGRMWIDAFANTRDGHDYTWSEGKWEKRNLWDTDKGCSFVLRGFHYHKWLWENILYYGRTHNNKLARFIQRYFLKKKDR